MITPAGALFSSPTPETFEPPEPLETAQALQNFLQVLTRLKAAPALLPDTAGPTTPTLTRVLHRLTGASPCQLAEAVSPEHQDEEQHALEAVLQALGSLFAVTSPSQSFPPPGQVAEGRATSGLQIVSDAVQGTLARPRTTVLTRPQLAQEATFENANLASTALQTSASPEAQATPVMPSMLTPSTDPGALPPVSGFTEANQASPGALSAQANGNSVAPLPISSRSFPELPNTRPIAEQQSFSTVLRSPQDTEVTPTPAAPQFPATPPAIVRALSGSPASFPDLTRSTGQPLPLAEAAAAAQLRDLAPTTLTAVAPDSQNTSAIPGRPTWPVAEVSIVNTPNPASSPVVTMEQTRQRPGAQSVPMIESPVTSTKTALRPPSALQASATHQPIEATIRSTVTGVRTAEPAADRQPFAQPQVTLMHEASSQPRSVPLRPSEVVAAFLTPRPVVVPNHVLATPGPLPAFSEVSQPPKTTLDRQPARGVVVVATANPMTQGATATPPSSIPPLSIALSAVGTSPLAPVPPQAVVASAALRTDATGRLSDTVVDQPDLPHVVTATGLQPAIGLGVAQVEGSLFTAEPVPTNPASHLPAQHSGILRQEQIPLHALRPGTVELPRPTSSLSSSPATLPVSSVVAPQTTAPLSNVSYTRVGEATTISLSSIGQSQAIARSDDVTQTSQILPEESGQEPQVALLNRVAVGTTVPPSVDRSTPTGTSTTPDVPALQPSAGVPGHSLVEQAQRLPSSGVSTSPPQGTESLVHTATLAPIAPVPLPPPRGVGNSVLSLETPADASAATPPSAGVQATTPSPAPYSTAILGEPIFAPLGRSIQRSTRQDDTPTGPVTTSEEIGYTALGGPGSFSSSTLEPGTAPPPPPAPPDLENLSRLWERPGPPRSVVLQLEPRELGTVLVQVRLTNQGIVASFRTENAAARTLLHGHLPALLDALQQQGVSTQHLSVSLGSEGWYEPFNVPRPQEPGFASFGQGRHGESYRRKKDQPETPQTLSSGEIFSQMVNMLI